MLINCKYRIQIADSGAVQFMIYPLLASLGFASNNDNRVQNVLRPSVAPYPRMFFSLDAGK